MLTAPPLAPQRVEVGRPIVASDHGFTVYQERRCPRTRAAALGDGREAAGPVVAVASEAADTARAFLAHHQPVAVVLNFVDPQRAGRRPRHLRRQALDEAGRTPRGYR